MGRRASVIVLIVTFWVAWTATRASNKGSVSSEQKAEGYSSMSQETVMIDLFNRWERVWHEGKFDLVPSCVAETYIRHDQKGDRTVTRDAYYTRRLRGGDCQHPQGEAGYSCGRLRSFVLG